jgi:hypothetical protein
VGAGKVLDIMSKPTVDTKEAVIDQDLTDRLITSLVFEISERADEIEQLKICIYGLARQRGLVREDVA